MALSACCRAEHLPPAAMVSINGSCAHQPLLCQAPTHEGGNGNRGMFQEDDKEWRNIDMPADADSYHSDRSGHGLTQDRLNSLVAFASAPMIERCCLFSIAVNTCSADLEQFRSAFKEVDRDGDGVISRRDLSASIDRAAIFFLPMEEDLLFRAVDMNNDGVVDFTEFVAGCLHASLAPLDHWLADQAFVALDRDHDGYLTTGDLKASFSSPPPGLPPVRKFGIEEWRRVVLQDADVNARMATPAQGAKLPPRQPTPSMDIFAVLFGGCQTVDEDHQYDFSVDGSTRAPAPPPQAVATKISSRPRKAPGLQHYHVQTGLSSPTYVPRAM
eukprot:TRINITY_DN76180_c0_g1_i1.p1 TRINITY_DN76180_c0_g1~~TRINITY_DN76180_c0_g1_i1.p1  ORF type:complete len:329 (+),score=70.26 TRINITY_DN76180_c0_g1_i1:64-1050(+)